MKERSTAELRRVTHQRLREYCKQWELSLIDVNSAAVEAYLDREEAKIRRREAKNEG